MPKLFDLGATVATPGALDLLQRAGVSASFILARHATGDWGDLDKSDKRDNDLGVKRGDRRLMSAYMVSGEKLWVITEWDHSVTTLLLPEEY